MDKIRKILREEASKKQQLYARIKKEMIEGEINFIGWLKICHRKLQSSIFFHNIKEVFPEFQMEDLFELSSRSPSEIAVLLGKYFIGYKKELTKALLEGQSFSIECTIADPLCDSVHIRFEFKEGEIYYKHNSSSNPFFHIIPAYEMFMLSAETIQ